MTQRSSVFQKRGLRPKKLQIFAKIYVFFFKEKTRVFSQNNQKISMKIQTFSKKRFSQSFREVSGVLQDEQQKWS